MDKADPVQAAAPVQTAGQFVGFDRNGYPGDARLPELHKSFAFVGYWLNNPPGAKQNGWAGKRQKLRDADFGFLVLWNGRLEAEIKKANVTPEALGQQDAAAAIAAAQGEGFPRHTVLFLDQEEGGRLEAVQSRQLHHDAKRVEQIVFIRIGQICTAHRAHDDEIAADEHGQLGDISTLADPSVVEELIQEHARR